MGRPYQWCLVILLILAACNPYVEPEVVSDDPVPDTTQVLGTVVLRTDSDEWCVNLFKEHLLYSEAMTEVLPEPWHIPSKEEAKILHTLYFSSSERFVTSDGYTFAMPSATVSKAGIKTKYSLLGLYVRRTVIVVTF